MKALLRRELYILKYNLIPFICIWMLLPMAIYLFISIPLSSQISIDVINYVNWSSIGNAVYASSILAYLLSSNLMLKYKNKTSFSNLMLASPQTNSQHLSAIVIWTGIIGLIQFLFSIVITQALNSSNLFFLDKILIMIYGLPIIIFVSNLAIFVHLLVDRKLVQTLVNSILIIFFLFSSGLFLPLNQAPLFLSYSPLYQTIINMQNIIMINSSVIYPSIIVLVLSAILFVINLVISYKVLRK
tara:strand:+ start:3819 stop:4547 length:729 start_codon:yes stop_codon:yes gene_type:complete